MDHLVRELEKSRVSIDIIPAGAIDQQQLAQHQLVISLGTRALETLLQLNSNTPVLAIMVPKDSFLSLSTAPAHQAARDAGRLSALYLEQPYWRQLRLAGLIAPGIERVGVLLGPISRTHQDELHAVIRQFGWQPQLTAMDNQDNPLAVIRSLVGSSDLLLAVPDQADFNRNTARWLLMLSLREQVPLIGFSRRYVEAGAVASVFSSPVSIAAEAAQWVLNWQQSSDHRLPAAGYPQRFEIRLNAEVASRLNLTLPPLEQISQALQEGNTP
ncbi:MAG TPA: hypothetical protein VIS52_05790 [Motiliproteus sp.]